MNSNFRIMMVCDESTFNVSSSHVAELSTGYHFDFQNSIDNALSQLPKFKPDLLIADSKLKNVFGFKKLRAQYPYLMILFRVDDDEFFLDKILTFGINGAVKADGGLEEFFTAVECMRQDKAYISPELLQKLFKVHERNFDSVLSAREIHILKFMAQGYTYTKISGALGLSPETVKTHMRNIYRKIGVNSRQEAIGKAMDNKWI